MAKKKRRRIKDNTCLSSSWYKHIDMGSIEFNMGVNQWSLSNREYRTLYEAQFLTDNRNLSLRQIADNVGVHHKTVWYELHKILPSLSISLYDEVCSILVNHKSHGYCYMRRMQEKAKKG